MAPRAELVLPQAATPRRIAMISMHTSPLDQPGTGDAGGMNVVVLELARRLARLGTEVEVFTRATSSDVAPREHPAPGVVVHSIPAGPFEGLDKEDLPAQLCAFTSGVLRTEASHEPGWYDLVHTHYWLSGQVGWLAKERWGVPLVHSMHTMAKVKNAALAQGDRPEPTARIVGEQQVVDVADRLVANTDDEAAALTHHYGADPCRVDVVHPGVDLRRFSPADGQAAARRRLGLPSDAVVLLFAGRIQPLKAPDVLLSAAAELLDRDPGLRDRLVVAVVGGPSGSGLARPHALEEHARRLGLSDQLRLHPPVPPADLADWYRAASLVAVPSRSESFGLVAVEAQACGTPVVAAAVGGLTTAVADGVSGRLVGGHNPTAWARAIADVLADRAGADVLARGARRHAAEFDWQRTAQRTLRSYAAAIDATRDARYRWARTLLTA
jgi:D-inositol-3-phosphate glycosyltransferase